LTDEVAAEMFVPLSQMPMNGMTLLVQTSKNLLSLAAAVRGEFAIDQTNPFDVKTMEQRVAGLFQFALLDVSVFGFAVLALRAASLELRNRFIFSESTHRRD
jgi:hypothetical protein